MGNLDNNEKIKILWNYFLKNGGQQFLDVEYPNYSNCKLKLDDVVCYNNNLWTIEGFKTDKLILRHLKYCPVPIDKKDFDQDFVTIHNNYDDDDGNTLSVYFDSVFLVTEVTAFSHYSTFLNGKKKKNLDYYYCVGEPKTDVVERKLMKVRFKRYE